MFLVAVLFLSLNSASISWADHSTAVTSQVNSNVYAQTADVTIRLEKNISEAKEEFPNSIETAQGVKRSPQKIEEVEEYEDMEDPFAGNEKDLPILSDPFEGYNRWMFGVNESLYDSAVEPFTRGYRNIVHEDLRIGIRNMFNNALFPVKILSSIVQLDFNKTGRVLARTLINTTWGFGGMADVAGEEFGMLAALAIVALHDPQLAIEDRHFVILTGIPAGFGGMPGPMHAIRGTPHVVMEFTFGCLRSVVGSSLSLIHI